MKQLLTFVDPSKQFNKQNEELTKIQIENSLELGWKPENIILATNFPWEYNGVKSTLVPDGCYYEKNNFYRSSKIPVINWLFETGLAYDLSDGLFWFHDNDAFQLEPFNELGLSAVIGGARMGITDHGWRTKWNAGSFFFTERAKDIFTLIEMRMDDNDIDEQDSLTELIDEGTVDGIMKLNITYNLGINKHKHTLKIADKPLMVAHFHPHKEHHMALYKDLINDRLKLIFQKHGIKN